MSLLKNLALAVVVFTSSMASANSLRDGVYAPEGTDVGCFELRNQAATFPYDFLWTKRGACPTQPVHFWGCNYTGYCDDGNPEDGAYAALEVVSADKLTFDGVAYRWVAVLPPLNLAPQWPFERRVIQVASGRDFRIDLSRLASDPEGEPLTFRIAQRPGLALDGSVLHGRAPVVDSLSSIEVMVAVSDGVNTINVTFTLFIAP